MKCSILVAIVIFFLSSTVAKSKPISIINQDTLTRKGVVIYLNQPFGLINKVRFKIGYKFEKRSTFLLVFTRFHNDLSYRISGDQVCTEYQYVIDKNKKSENFIYGKAGFGNYNFSGETFSSIFYSSTRSGSGSYFLIGAGFGQELFLNKSKTFLIQFNEGLKFNKIYQATGGNPQNRLYFPLNPGSLIDLNINLGLKF